jgi:hypothetical protein
MAFEGVSLNKSVGDTTTAPAYLIRPFVSVVKEALSQWVSDPNPLEPSGQRRIVQAGVGGEPLYVTALREVDLSEEEIEKIGQFYKFLGE